ncbi:MAG: TonB family protein [Flavipsychrobacter sp.]|nr:TonB family protein [Flavipsychrobacter sp.]
MMYLIQVVAYTGILYLVYALLLRNKPIHAFNRAYLLGAVLLPIVMPFLKLSALTNYFEQNRAINMRLPEIVATGGYEKQVMTQTVNWGLIAYASVAIVLFALFIYKRIRLHQVIKRSTRVQEERYTILLNTSYGPGSWGRYIFLPDETINETIIQHEAAHVYMKHSTDVVLMQILQCLFWPNLFLHAINKELKQIHEFQADAAVGMDRQQYSELLLSNVFDTCTLPLTHSFNIHPLKRRIAMLKKRKSPMAIVFGAAAILATGAVVFNVVALQSCKAKKWEVMKAQEVDKMAEFNGDYVKFMTENLVYPKEAMDKGIEGKVMVKFIVNEEGKVVYRDIIKSPDTLLSLATIDVLRKMPWWKPAEKDGKKVAVEFIMPVVFELGGEEQFVITNHASEKTDNGYSWKLSSLQPIEVADNNINPETVNVLQRVYDLLEQREAEMTGDFDKTLGKAAVSGDFSILATIQHRDATVRFLKEKKALLKAEIEEQQ